MKQLRIDYVVYDQQGVLRFASTFETTYYEELPESILKSALNLLKHGAGDGWYAITDIRTIAIDGFNISNDSFEKARL